MSNAPLVSIVTPVFNGEKYIETCINSVLKQDYGNIEHIFVDAGSKDNTLEILGRYQQKYPGRIKFASGKDRGPCDAWNKGWKMASGDILGWLGADDVLEDGAIGAVIDFFRGNPDASFVFGECNYIDKDGSIIGSIPTRDYRIQDALNRGNYLPTLTAFYKRRVIEEVGPVDININLCDHEYWIRVSRKFRVYRIEKFLASFRLTDRSVSGRKGVFSVYAREMFMINRRHGGRLFSRITLKYLVSLLVPDKIIDLIVVPLWALYSRRHRRKVLFTTGPANNR